MTMQYILTTRLAVLRERRARLESLCLCFIPGARRDALMTINTELRRISSSIIAGGNYGWDE